MIIIISKGSLNKKDFERARKDYGSYVKLTIDLEREIVALGGEYHADAEKMLLEKGSQQKDIWGGGLNLETKKLETNAIINLKAGINDSTEIMENLKREKFLEIAKRFLKDYVN